MASEPVKTLIAEGREAFERGDAKRSRAAFEAALAERESGDLLEGLARAYYLEGDYEPSIDAHQRAFVAYQREGDTASAARAARILSWLHLNVYGDFAVAGGWLARAEDLVEQAGVQTTERGWTESCALRGSPMGRAGRGGFVPRLSSPCGLQTPTCGSRPSPGSARRWRWTGALRRGCASSMSRWRPSVPARCGISMSSRACSAACS